MGEPLIGKTGVKAYVIRDTCHQKRRSRVYVSWWAKSANVTFQRSL